jgi:hypothetical protein
MKQHDHNQLSDPSMTLDNWTAQLAQGIAHTLQALAPGLKQVPLAMIALDCHPWNGGLFLAILQQSEVEQDPEIGDPAEMAAWELYDCGQALTPWLSLKPLASQMAAAYRKATDPAVVANQYLQAAANALSGAQVRAAIEQFPLDDAFRLSVAHPDSDHEFCL